MFQYILQWRYVLTIVLVASIVWYIVFYVLEWFALKRVAMRHHEDNDDWEDADVVEIDSVMSIQDEDGNEIMIFEHEDMLLQEDDSDDSEDDDLDDEDDDEIIFIEEDEEEQEDSDDDSDDDVNDEEDTDTASDDSSTEEKDEPKQFRKHKVKNIAEWVSREDILQDKHEKNLKKIKYEALLFKQRNDMAGYEKKLIEWLILDPDDIDIYRQLADFYFSDGKYTKALSMFRKILAFDENDHHALWQIWEIYIEQWQYEDAQVFIEKALSLSRDNPKYYISLIDICIAKNDMQTALTHLEKIVALRPRNISYLMALGEMYEKLWRSEDAKQTYFRVLEVDPLHADVKHILKRF